MRPNTAEEVFELLDGCTFAAAVGTAMEFGLFWRLAEKPMPAQDIARSLDIPFNRCQIWLQLLCRTGLLELGNKGYVSSATAQGAILQAFSQETWAFLACSAREGTPAIRDLAENISKPVSSWELQNLQPPDYLQQIREDADYAARFTRMLYELHVPLANQLAKMLDMQGIAKLMDLGGGSGVISHALLRKHAGLTSDIVEHEHVCAVGREIARENELEKQVRYIAADFVKDDLPTGYDMVLLCDVGPQNENVLSKIRDVLVPDGRLAIVSKFASDVNTAVPSRLVWAFHSSLESPAETCSFTTVDREITSLQRVGYRDIEARPVPSEDQLRWNSDWTLLQARK